MKKTLQKSLLFLAGALLSNNVIASDFEVDSISYNVLSLTDLTCGVVSSTKTSPEIVIPETVTYNSKTLTVISIEAGAFENSTTLESIILPGSVKTIGGSAFYYCDKLNNISLNQVETIGAQAFRCCSALKIINIPSTITSIGEMAFEGCNLTAVHITDLSAWCKINFKCSSWYGNFNTPHSNPLYNAKRLFLNNELITNLKIPSDVTAINSFAFINCTNLTEVIIPGNINSIGTFAFKGCSNLKNLTIEDSENSLTINTDGSGFCAFEDCPLIKLYLGRDFKSNSQSPAFRDNNELKNLTIGSKVTSLSSQSFLNCDSIVNIQVHNSTPPTLNAEDVFDSKVYLDAIVTVPQGALSTYQTTKYWQNFFATKEADNTNSYRVSALYDNTQGKVLINESINGPIFINQDNKVEFYIIPNKEYLIKQVLLNNIDITDNLDNNNTFKVNEVTEDLTLEVIFTEKKDMALTISHAENGSVTMEAYYGQTFSLNITPKSGWQVNSVTFNGTDVTSQINDGWYITPEIIEASTISIVFESKNDNIIENVATNSNIRVYGYNNLITVSGTEPTDIISIFNSNGQQVYSGFETAINIPNTGIYIVKVAGRTYKVAL